MYIFCIWIGLDVLFFKNNILLWLSNFFVFLILIIVCELIWDDIVNVICVGMFDLIKFVIIFIDGCCVVINKWIL